LGDLSREGDWVWEVVQDDDDYDGMMGERSFTFELQQNRYTGVKVVDGWRRSVEPGECGPPVYLSPSGDMQRTLSKEKKK
jgi:hypothetical protein